MPKISISQASREWGISRQTLYRKADKGDISLSGTSKPFKIDTSEMIRVFGNVTSDSHKRTESDNSDSLLLQSKNEQIQQLHSEIEHLRQQNDNLLEQLGKRGEFEQKLLTQQSTSKPFWKKLF